MQVEKIDAPRGRVDLLPVELSASTLSLFGLSTNFTDSPLSKSW